MERVNKVIEILLKTKATNLCKINISKISSLTDYFILASCSSSTAVNYVADFMEIELKKCGINLLRRNGKMGETWIVLDQGDFICHLFTVETREFYNLEKLWGAQNNLEYFGEE